MTTATRWRTQPKYEGLCSDGWFLDSQSRLRYRPNPLDAVDLDALPPRPLLSVRAIDGILPSPAKVRTIEAAIGEVPDSLRQKLQRAGARIELIAGRDVAAHPLFRYHAAGRYAGMTRFGDPLAAVAVDIGDDPAATVLHEIGHLADFHLWRHVSHSPAWLRIWRADVAAGKVPEYVDQRQKPEEYLCESCSRLWNPRRGIWPASRAAAQFIEGLT